MPKIENEKARWVTEAVSKYEGVLLSYTLRLIRNIEKAREIVQEAFLKLWNVKREKVEGHLAPWLFRVCRNRSLDILRRENKMELLEDEKFMKERPGPDVTEDIDKRDCVKNVRDAMTRLSKRQQEVLVLKFQNDLSYKEISQITGLSVSNVGYLIHEGVQNLRKNLGSGEEDL